MKPPHVVPGDLVLDDNGEPALVIGVEPDQDRVLVEHTKTYERYFLTLSKIKLSSVLT